MGHLKVIYISGKAQIDQKSIFQYLDEILEIEIKKY